MRYCHAVLAICLFGGTFAEAQPWYGGRRPVMGEPGSGVSVGYRGGATRQYGSSAGGDSSHYRGYGGNYGYGGFGGVGPYFPVHYGSAFYGGGFYGGGFPVAYGFGYYGGPWGNPGFGYSPYGWGGAISPVIAPVVGYSGYYQPWPINQAPQVDVSQDPAIMNALRENADRWGRDLPEPKPDPIRRPVVPSSNEAMLRSLELQRQGDDRLLRQQWGAALSLYRRSVSAADDRAEGHYRLAFASAAARDFVTAVREFQRGLYLDPTYPASGVTLETIFGPENLQTKTMLLEQVTLWVREDVRDPDRLFLLGTLLHFEGDPRSREFLETGYRLAGRGDHFLALLNPQETPVHQAAPPARLAPPTTIPAVKPPVVPEVFDLPPAAPELEDRDKPAGPQIPPAPAPAPESPQPLPPLPGVTDSPELPPLAAPGLGNS